jgi:sugar phosphate permease
MLVLPTWVRYRVVALATVVAILLYLDRYCLSLVDRRIIADLGLTEQQMSFIHGSFFLTYAFGQMPFGYFADRFGPRRILSSYIVLWSILTGMMGLARGFGDLLIYRLGCGLFESGAYPACSGMIRRWVPITQRGTASGIVSLGGRIGGAITPFLVSRMLLVFGSVATINTLFYGETWRPTFVAFGAFGVAVAVYFAFRHRDNPREHPEVNEAEIALIEAPAPAAGSAVKTEREESFSAAPPPVTIAAEPLPVAVLIPRILSNFHFWLLSVYQFGANFGWAFFLTYLNRYLQEVHGVTDDTERGTIQTIILTFALPALILGGLLTDMITRRLGQRWGRVLPLTIPRILAGLAYAAVVLVEPGSVWTVTFLFATVLFCSEVCLPSIWAYCMDVGGRNTALVLGWGNMIGNLGAFASPVVVQYLVEHYGWNAVWLTCSGVFIGMSLLCLGIDSRNKIAD